MFFYYADLADRIFRLLNGRINRLNTNIFLLINDDLESYGAIYLRSVIYINLNKIILSSKGKENTELNILYTIAHELFHADQYIEDEQYLNNESYRIKKEDEVTYRAITFILLHKEELEYKLNITINSDLLMYKINGLNVMIDSEYIADYQRYNLEQIVEKNLIVLLRKYYSDDWKRYDNVAINFGNGKNILNNNFLKLEGSLLNCAPSLLQSLIRDFSVFLTGVYVKYEMIDNIFVIIIYIKDPVLGIIEEREEEWGM